MGAMSEERWSGRDERGSVSAGRRLPVTSFTRNAARQVAHPARCSAARAQAKGHAHHERLCDWRGVEEVHGGRGPSLWADAGSPDRREAQTQSSGSTTALSLSSCAAAAVSVPGAVHTVHCQYGLGASAGVESFRCWAVAVGQSKTCQARRRRGGISLYPRHHSSDIPYPAWQRGQ